MSLFERLLFCRTPSRDAMRVVIASSLAIGATRNQWGASMSTGNCSLPPVAAPHSKNVEGGK